MSPAFSNFALGCVVGVISLGVIQIAYYIIKELFCDNDYSRYDDERADKYLNANYVKKSDLIALRERIYNYANIYYEAFLDDPRSKVSIYNVTKMLEGYLFHIDKIFEGKSK